MDLDKIDLSILRILQNNAKATIKEMATELGMSTTPIFDRIKRLEAQGVISKYVAIVDPAKLNKKLRVFIEISMADHSGEAINKFVNEITDHREVIECHHVTGDSDFLIVLQTRDIESYNEFITKKLFKVSNVGKVRSSFSLSVKKQTTAISLS